VSEDSGEPTTSSTDVAEAKRLLIVRAMREAEAIEKRIGLTEGARLVQLFASVRGTHRIFDANSQELGELLVLNASDEFARHLWDVRNRALLAGFLDEATRRLHNYVASAMSLVDHTRKAINKVYAPNTQPRTEYDERIRTDFVESPEIRFVQDLRDLMLHVDAPHVNARFTLRREPERGGELRERRELILNRPRLLAWNGWSPPARAILARETDDDLPIEPLIRYYTARVSAFYNWLAEWHRRQHPAAYSELETLQKQLRDVVVAGGLVDLGDPTTKPRSLREIKQSIDAARRAAGLRRPSDEDESSTH
jgi:hypothetical protein